MIRLLAVALLGLLSAPEARADDALARGEKLLARRDFVRAEATLREAVAASPTDPRAHGNLALALLQQSKTREAIDSARLAAAFGPNIPETRFIYGLALKSGGRLLEAAREFERAVALKPDNEPALHALAETYAAAGDERALPAYERLVRLEPDRPEIRIEYAESLWAAGHRDLGNGVAADAAKAFPASLEVAARYGRALFDQERFLDAARELRRARELGATDISTLSLLGNALWQADATDDAKAVFGEAVGQHPESAALRQDLGRLLLSRGEAETAIPHLQEAVRLKPAEAAAALELGRAHEAAGRTAEAEAAYRQAIVLGPTLSAAHYALGRLLVRAGRAAEGERELAAYRRIYDRAAQRTDESNVAAAQLALGWAELSRGDSDAALSRFASLPETADALVGRAAALTRLRRHADAARALERARELLPSDLHIQFLLASARARAETEP